MFWFKNAAKVIGFEFLHKKFVFQQEVVSSRSTDLWVLGLARFCCDILLVRVKRTLSFISFCFIDFFYFIIDVKRYFYYQKCVYSIFNVRIIELLIFVWGIFSCCLAFKLKSDIVLGCFNFSKFWWDRMLWFKKTQGISDVRCCRWSFSYSTW